MKKYEIDRSGDEKLYKDLLKEDTKLTETSITINTVQDAEESIAKCIMLIMKKKNMSRSACIELIGDGIISGIDSANEVMPAMANNYPDKFNKQQKLIAAGVSRKIMTYAKTK
jgi:hypothetical protein